MKIYPCVILVSLILYIQNTCESEKVTVKEKKEDCIKRELSEKEKKKGAKHCCFSKYKVKDVTFEVCGAFSENEYKNLFRYIKEAEMNDDVDIKTIDCKSSYLKLGTLALIFLLF